MTANQLHLENITRALKKHTPDIKQVNDRGHAAVAMLLRDAGLFPEILFIIRAKHDNDPWSGNIGFPGGRLNHGGETPHEAAVRETGEELGFDLSNSSCLGQLDDLYGAIMPVLVSCFVYRVDEKPDFSPNHEIEHSFWYPLPMLLERSRHQHKTFFYRGEERTHPTITILEEGQPLLWGITYRLIRNFFALCGHSFGTGESPESRSG